MTICCSHCPEKEEIRPYGENGTYICYECMMETPERRATAFLQMGMAFQAVESTGSAIVIGGKHGPVPLTNDKTRLN